MTHTCVHAYAGMFFIRSLFSKNYRSSRYINKKAPRSINPARTFIKRKSSYRLVTTKRWRYFYFRVITSFGRPKKRMMIREASLIVGGRGRSLQTTGNSSRPHGVPNTAWNNRRYSAISPDLTVSSITMPFIVSTKLLHTSIINPTPVRRQLDPICRHF